jgi:hypothetical protein
MITKRELMLRTGAYMPLKKGGFWKPVGFAPTSVTTVIEDRLQSANAGFLLLTSLFLKERFHAEAFSI